MVEGEGKGWWPTILLLAPSDFQTYRHPASCPEVFNVNTYYKVSTHSSTVKLGNKERFDKEQIGIKEPFPVTNLPFTS